MDKSQVGSCKESPHVYVPKKKKKWSFDCIVMSIVLIFFKLLCGHFCVQHRSGFPSLTASNGVKWIPIISYCKLVLNTSEENLESQFKTKYCALEILDVCGDNNYRDIDETFHMKRKLNCEMNTKFLFQNHAFINMLLLK